MSVIVVSLGLLASFFACNYVISNVDTNFEKGHAIYMLDFYWGVIRAIGLILNIM